MTLFIGNKRYSSWSMRPWILMTHFKIPFTEVLIPLDTETTREEILKVNGSGKVPALRDGELTIWDSLAITEYLHEKFPALHLWPLDPTARAVARSVSNEMHAGFLSMRQHMSHDVQRKLVDFDFSPAREDIGRIKEIWLRCLNASGGPFLFGNFSIADAMYAPVVNRFVSYGIPIDLEQEALISAYVSAILATPAVKAWNDAGKKENLLAPLHV